MRELVSYYPQNMRPPTELLMAKVKAKLPATVAAQLDDAGFLLNRTLTYEEFYETLNRADQRCGNGLWSRATAPSRSATNPLPVAETLTGSAADNSTAA